MILVGFICYLAGSFTGMIILSLMVSAGRYNKPRKEDIDANKDN